MIAMGSSISGTEYVPVRKEEGQDTKVFHQHVLEGSTQGATVFKADQISFWQVEGVKKILGFKNLSKNWDSYGSQPPAQVAIKNAIEFLMAVPFEKLQPRILPVAGGSVSLEWRRGNRGLQIEFLSEGSIEYLFIEGGEPKGKGGVLPYSSPLVVKTMLSCLLAK
jgi:hypothetical protein